MWPYLAMFFAAVFADLLPVIGPPVWTIMVFMVVRFDLNPWGVLAVGVPGSVLGRYGLSRYISKLLNKVIRRTKADEMRFAGQQLNGSRLRAWPAILLYSLLPLSTTALFSMAGLAGVRPIQILPPFFVGKFISDAAMLFAGRYALRNSADLIYGTFSWKGMSAAAAGVVLLAVFLLLDWRLLIERRKIRFDFHIWKIDAAD
ncbi:MAG TPA: hypothetical protein VG838_03535 [Opitutaceae bacterium]|nr:hypothetical protein [Opitutaceae bacterium]